MFCKPHVTNLLAGIVIGQSFDTSIINERI